MSMHQPRWQRKASLSSGFKGTLNPKIYGFQGLIKRIIENTYGV